MMNSRLSILLACSTGLTALVAAPTLAQDNTRDALIACRGESDSLARLVCYDRIVDQMSRDSEFGQRESRVADAAGAAAEAAPERRRLIPRVRFPGFGNRDEERAVAEADRGDDAVAEFGSRPVREPSLAESDITDESQVVERNRDGTPDTVRMPIASYRVVGLGTHIFTMENGQVWRQTDERSVRIPRGDIYAEISEAALDSYMMRINGQGRSIRVRRIDNR